MDVLALMKLKIYFKVKNLLQNISLRVDENRIDDGNRKKSQKM